MEKAKNVVRMQVEGPVIRRPSLRSSRKEKEATVAISDIDLRSQSRNRRAGGEDEAFSDIEPEGKRIRAMDLQLIRAIGCQPAERIDLQRRQVVSVGGIRAENVVRGPIESFVVPLRPCV